MIRSVWRVHIHGAENEPDPEAGPYLLCSNHISAMDPILVCACTEKQQPHFMAKKDLFYIPVIHLLIRLMGAYPIHRDGSDIGAIRKTLSLLAEGKSVGMFPQGHRYPGKEPVKTEVKSGVGMIESHAKVQVLPVLLKPENYRVKAFHRLDMYIGKPIAYEELAACGEGRERYQKMAELVFSHICALSPAQEKPED